MTFWHRIGLESSEAKALEKISLKKVQTEETEKTRREFIKQREETRRARIAAISYYHYVVFAVIFFIGTVGAGLTYEKHLKAKDTACRESVQMGSLSNLISCTPGARVETTKVTIKGDEYLIKCLCSPPPTMSASNGI